MKVLFNNLIDFNEMPLSDWENLYLQIEKIIDNPVAYANCLSGRVLATPFYEPSTRTLFSFQTAMLRLGGTYIGFSDPGNSSVAKGESLKDTVRMLSGYADMIVMRHPLEGAAFAASLFSEVPVINAGDGGHLHPTQTLTDLVTIRKTFGRTSGLTVGLCGDLKNGRTVHSLIKALSRFENNSFCLISTPELRIPDYIKDHLDFCGCAYTEADSLEENIGNLDVLYMTRIQKERFSSAEEYKKQAGKYVLTGEKMKAAKQNMIVLHPLPRVDEISEDVDSDPRALYFTQARYGMFTRMGLLNTLAALPRGKAESVNSNVADVHCKNPRCITNHEKNLPELFKRPESDPSSLICMYCDHPAEI